MFRIWTKIPDSIFHADQIFEVDRKESSSGRFSLLDNFKLFFKKINIKNKQEKKKNK